MLNILIPMAGLGSRFSKNGYKYPKPLIDVNGIPMIQCVIKNLNLHGNYIFLVLREHYEKYYLKYLLPLICCENNCEIIIVDSVTEGACCTALLAKKIINTNDELIIANSDQFILGWMANNFFNYVNIKQADGAILTFIDDDSKWSFVKLNKNSNIISQVAEKKPISNIASVGIYYWKKGSDFVESAEKMIQQNIRVNNEFYIAPTYNILINEGKKIYNYPIAEMHGLGTPEDLNRFLQLEIKV